MFSIIGLITGLAGPIAQIANKIADLQMLKAQTASNEELSRINRDIEEAHDRKAILIAEAGNRIAGTINASMRFLLALSSLAILTKLMFWDKVVGSFMGCSGKPGELPENLMRCASFTTDRLDAYQWAVITAVIAFYFAYDMATKRK